MQITAMQKPAESITLKTGMKGNPLAAKSDNLPQTKPNEVQPVQTSPVQGTQTAPDHNLQMMAAREIAMREEQRKWTRERDDLQAKLARFETEYIPKSALLEKPYETLTGAGVDYSKVTQDALAHLNDTDPVAQHIKTLEAKINSLETGFTETKTQMQQAQDQAYKDALRQIDSDAQAIVKARTDDFELLSASGAAPKIYRFVEQIFHKGLPAGGDDQPEIKPGTILGVDEAAAMLESFQLEEFKKLGQTKKGQALMRTLLFGDEKSQQKVQASPGASTITNSMAGAAKPLSPRDRAIRQIEEMRRAQRA